MSPRVLHVIARMNQGGTATYLNNLLSGLEERGFQTLLCYGETQGSETESRVLAPKNIKSRHLGRKLNILDDFMAFIFLTAQVKQFKPDIIHSHTFKAGLLARMLSKKIPKVHTYHGHHIYDPDFKGIKGRILVRIEKLLAKRTSVFVGVGENVVHDLLREGIGSLKQFENIPPGIKPIKRTSRLTAEKKLGVKPSSRFTVLWMGRLTAVKNPNLLIEISKAMPHIRFLIGGDGELMSSMKSQAPKNLQFLGWSDIGLLLSASDVVISTSFSEGMPLALIESQLFGRPVIATNVGSVSEIVQDHVTGYLVEANAFEFIRTIEILSNDFRLNDKMGKAASTNANSRFTLEIMIERHAEIYSRLLSRMDS